MLLSVLGITLAVIAGASALAAYLWLVVRSVDEPTDNRNV